MRKHQRFAFLSIGGLALFAAIAPGLTADIAVPPAAETPAAGQGVVTVQGFGVADVDWDVDDLGDVNTVRFTIVRAKDGAADVEAAADGESGNAIVRVRLEGTDGTLKEFVFCEVVENAAECDTSPSIARMAALDLGQVNIIAFDKN